MAKFLAVVLGALIGVGVVYFVVVQPRQAARSHQAGATGAASSTSAGEGQSDVKGPEVRAPAPKGEEKPLTADEVAAAAAGLTDEDDVVRGSALEQWGALVEMGSESAPRIAVHPELVEAVRPLIDGMPEFRLIPYVEAWGGTPWWVREFPEAHGRYTAWRATANDNIWLPYAYDQLDRFDPDADREQIRGILEVLLRSSSAKVRKRSLESAAHYLGSESRQYAMEMLRDPENSVARLAWLVAAKTGGVPNPQFDWANGPRFVGEAVLYTLAVQSPEEAMSVCDMLAGDPVVSQWYESTIPLIRDRASGRSDRETIVTVNPGAGPGRVFEEAIRVEELLSGNYPQYVQE